ncbi:MAG: CRTAC1 family protein [Acidobacteriaceae bacterium]
MHTGRRKFLNLSLAALAGAALESAHAQQVDGMGRRVATALRKPPASGRPFYARFTDVASAAGLTAPVIYGGVDRDEYIIEANGCGCAFFDFDNDGWMDIFVLSGTRLNGPPPGTTNRLYKNNRDGTFQDVTRQAGLEAVGWANSVSVGDYNNDGYEDLFCTYFGQNRLYKNLGNGTFKDVTKEAGLLNSEPRWGAGSTFVDYNRDGHLDLFVSNYLQFDFKKAPRAGSGANCNFKGIPIECGPRGLPFGQHSLYRNNGDGTFIDVSKESGIGRPWPSYGMTVGAADFNEDGWPDIYVASDSTPSLQFMNQRDGTFKEEGVERGVALSSDGGEEAGMGIGVGDYNLRGHLDIFKTHFSDDTDVLYENDGTGNFDDRTISSKIAVETRFSSWGTGIVDLDNDGWPDIFFVTGSVYPNVEKTLPQYPDKSPRILFRNLGNGTFEEIDDAGPGVTAAHSSRGCAFGDFDNDGDMDILIINMNEPPSLLRNDLKGTHHWIKVKLVGTKSNRSAIGARVIAKYGGHIQAQEVMSQSSYYSCNDSRLHFGLGPAVTTDLSIHWPNGLLEHYSGIKCDQLITIQEAHGVIANAGWGR